MIHTIFDLAAAALAFQAIRLTQAWRPPATEPAAFQPAYAASLVIGAVLGAYLLGTLNLWLSGLPGIGRSILGALCGAILSVEFFKRATGIKGSTGAIFVPGFTVAVIVGRIGCYLSGLPDNTFGTPTALPWGHDFGDGIPRHPVQLYESALMTLFGLAALTAMARRNPFYTRNAFYLMTGFYAAAGLYAIEHHVTRLADDHAHAKLIGARLARIAGVEIDMANLQTNIIVFKLGEGAPDAATVVARAKAQGVLVFAFSPRLVRAVTHLDVSRQQCETAAEVLAAAING